MRADKSSQYTWETLHEILGIPLGASIDHIKKSYRLLSRKNSVTDAAYRILTDSEERGKHHALHSSGTEDGRDWGKRGRERCSCGRSDATRETPAVIIIRINWQLVRDRPGRVGWRRGS